MRANANIEKQNINLTVAECQPPSVLILREWIFNDDGFKWRKWNTKTDYEEKDPNQWYGVLEIYKDNEEGKDFFDFEVAIEVSVPLFSEKSHIWVEQNKEQFVIREYVYVIY